MPAMAPPDRPLLDESTGAGAGAGAGVGAAAEPLRHGQLPKMLRSVLLSCAKLMVRLVLGGTEHEGELSCDELNVGGETHTTRVQRLFGKFSTDYLKVMQTLSKNHENPIQKP